MRSTIFVVLSLLTSVWAQASGLFINTPTSLITCQPYLLTFGGGQAPYFLSVVPGGQSSAPNIEILSSGISATTFTWVVNLSAGMNVTMRIGDSAGGVNFSGAVVIQAGSSTSCVGQAVQSSSSSSGAAATTPASSTTAAASTTSSAPSAASSSTTTTTSSMASSTTSAMSSSMMMSSSTTSAAAQSSTTTTTTSKASATTSAPTMAPASGAGTFSFSSNLVALVAAAALAMAA